MSLSDGNDLYSTYNQKTSVMPGEYTSDRLAYDKDPPHQADLKKLITLVQCSDQDQIFDFETRLLVNANARWLRCVESVSSF